jgi:hypothetical protein
LQAYRQHDRDGRQVNRLEAEGAQQLVVGVRGVQRASDVSEEPAGRGGDVGLSLGFEVIGTKCVLLVDLNLDAEKE